MSGTVPDTLMPRSYGPPYAVARLCALAAQAAIFELLHIVLSGHMERKSFFCSNIRYAKSGVSTTRKRQQNVSCAACAHKRANARAAP